MNPQQQLNLFVIYTAKSGGVRRAEKVLITTSKNEAIKEANKEFGIAEVVDLAVAPVEDVVRLVLPTLMVTLINVQQLLGVVAQDAQERTIERNKGRLGLVGKPV